MPVGGLRGAQRGMGFAFPGIFKGSEPGLRTRMEICKGWSKRPLPMSSKQTYQPEELIRRVLPSTAPPESPLVCQPVWVRLEGQSVRLHSKEEIELACRLVCIHHNSLVDDEMDSDDEMDQSTEEESSGEETEEGEVCYE